MKVLHILPHLGGGVGTVIIDWMKKIGGKDHHVMCLDTMNHKGRDALEALGMGFSWNQRVPDVIKTFMVEADIVLTHFWDHPMLAELFSEPVPDCRMVFWCHKNFKVPVQYLMLPDRFIGTSPVQDHNCIIKDHPYEYIWSTGNMDRFLAIEPKSHDGFNIGYVGTVDYKKVHAEFLTIHRKIKELIPEARFTIVGENNLIAAPWTGDGLGFVGKVDDVAPYLAEMDVFAYPLRSDHYGTCEIALGEAMAAGVVPVVMGNIAELEIMKGSSFSNAYSSLIAKDEKEFVNHIEFLYRDLKSRTALSSNASKFASWRYSIDNMIQQWDNVFQEMMQKPKEKRSLL